MHNVHGRLLGTRVKYSTVIKTAQPVIYSKLSGMLRNSGQCKLQQKGKEAYLYSAFYMQCISQSAQAWITQFYLQIHHACLSFVCVHRMALCTSNWGKRHLIAAYYSSINPEGMKGWVGLVGWLIAEVYPHKWSPVSYRSSAGQRIKYAGQRPTFYYWATQPTNKKPSYRRGTVRRAVSVNWCYVSRGNTWE